MFIFKTKAPTQITLFLGIHTNYSHHFSGPSINLYFIFLTYMSSQLISMMYGLNQADNTV